MFEGEPVACVHIYVGGVAFFDRADQVKTQIEKIRVSRAVAGQWRRGYCRAL